MIEAPAKKAKTVEEGAESKKNFSKNGSAPGQRVSTKVDKKPFDKKKFGGDGEKKPFKKFGDGDSYEKKPFKKFGDGPEKKPFKKFGDGDNYVKKPFKKFGDGDSYEK